MGSLKVRGYVVERLLGGGASGEVWQARVASSGAPVALKRIAIRDDEQLRRAHAEAALLAALDHPNLVRLHTMIVSGDAVVLVLDLADGGSLADLLDARGRLTPGEVITAVAPVAAALEYLHGAGVVHGDVSAANILFTASGVPLLADVGVARLTGDDADADAEATPAYVDPAVAAGCVPGPQSDVFMLGGVALHALTGAPPWPDENADAALARAAMSVLDDVPERLEHAGVSPEMVTVLGRALAVDPHRRGTAADLALDLAHSGQPLAVELSAGLARREPQRIERLGPRHAALSARPAFERPSSSAPLAADVAPPTRMVGPRPRPVIARPVRRRFRPGLFAAIAAAVLAAGLVVGVAWARSTGHEGPGPGASSISRPQVETNRTATAENWAARLAGLDALRAKAFATRDPALLRQVYAPGRLLTADRALLARIVPRGCGLAGVRTRYSDVHTSARGGRIVLSVVATLRPSRLVCRGRLRGTAAGAGPTTLRLELIRVRSEVRIAAQRPA
jgi:hypothetical protein